MGGGLSIGPRAAKRQIGNEWPQIRDLYGSQFNQLNDWMGSQPLFQQAQQLFGQAQGAIPTGNLQGLESSIPGFDPSVGSQGLNSAYDSLYGASNFLGGAGQIGSDVLSSIRNNVSPVLQSGGALTPEQERDVSQASRGILGAQGTNLHGNQALGAELLNRQNAQQQRYNLALGQAQQGQNQMLGLEQGALGLEQGGLGLAQGQMQQQAQNFGMGQQQFADTMGLRTGQFGQSQGIFGDIAGLINAPLGIEQGAISGFSQLTNPLLTYAGNLFGQNLASQLATQQANQNKGGQTVDTSLSAIGRIIGGIAQSDKALKTKIKNVGEKTPEGIPIKTFQFKGDPQERRYIGVIAQDVQKKVPEAVMQHPGTGHLAVDFSQINAPYHQIGGPMAMQGQSRSRGGGGPPSIEWRGLDNPPGLPPPDLPPVDLSPEQTHAPFRELAQQYGADPGQRLNFGGNPWTNPNALGPFGNTPPLGTPGWAQGPTLIPTYFDPMGYPYAVPANQLPLGGRHQMPFRQPT